MRDKKTLSLTLLACFLWGSAFPTIKQLYEVMGIGNDFGVKMLLAGIRFILAGIMILLYYRIRYKRNPLLSSLRDWQQVFLLGLFQTTFMYAFFYISIYNMSGVKTSVMSQTSIFFVVIIAHYIYKDEKMHFGKVIGLLLGIAAIVIVNFNAFSHTEGLFEFRFNGEGFMLISNLFSAGSTFWVKSLSKKMAPVLLTAWQLLLGGVVLASVGLLTAKESLNFSHPATLPLLIYASLISSAAFTLWYSLLQSNKASELSMVRFTIPIIGTVLSVLLLPGESLTVNILFGLILVVIGIWMCNRPRPFKARLINENEG